MNFISTFEELNKLYESLEAEHLEEAATGFRLTGQQQIKIENIACELQRKDCDMDYIKDELEDLDQDITTDDLQIAADVSFQHNKLSKEIYSLQSYMKNRGYKTFGDFYKALDDIKESLTESDEEILEDNEVAEETVEVNDYVLECSKCGALVIKAIKEVTEDEESGLVNVGEECAFCEASKGFKVLGTFAPYEEGVEAEAPEEATEAEAETEVIEIEDNEVIEEGIFDKFKKNNKPQQKSKSSKKFGVYQLTDPTGMIQQFFPSERDARDWIAQSKSGIKYGVKCFDVVEEGIFDKFKKDKTKKDDSAEVNTPAKKEEPKEFTTYSYDEWIQAVEAAHKAYAEEPAEAARTITYDKVMEIGACKNLCNDILAYIEDWMKAGGKKLDHKSYAKHLEESVDTLNELFGFGKKKKATPAASSSSKDNSSKESKVTFDIYDENGTQQFSRTFTEIPGKMDAEAQLNYILKDKYPKIYNSCKNNRDWMYERTSVPASLFDTKRNRTYFTTEIIR